MTAGAPAALALEVQQALNWLRARSSQATLDGMARYGIPSDHALGVTMKDMKALGTALGRNHELAAALWKTGVYEARMVCSFVDEPALVTAAQLDRWCKDFDSWAICDTICFNLFDRTPHAWAKVAQWSTRRGEFEKRAAFALLWSLAAHDRSADNEQFLQGLALIEHASDDREYVKKAVNMALRAVGKRSRTLNAAAVAVATRMADAAEPSRRWVGRDAVRELTSAAVLARLKR